LLLGLLTRGRARTLAFGWTWTPMSTTALHAYLERMGTVIGAAGCRGERAAPCDRTATERAGQAVIRLLEPDRAALRLPVDKTRR